MSARTNDYKNFYAKGQKTITDKILLVAGKNPSEIWLETID
jgi:hypothetical protein